VGNSGSCSSSSRVGVLLFSFFSSFSLFGRFLLTIAYPSSSTYISSTTLTRRIALSSLSFFCNSFSHVPPFLPLLSGEEREESNNTTSSIAPFYISSSFCSSALRL
jgi:hypothetical protein